MKTGFLRASEEGIPSRRGPCVPVSMVWTGSGVSVRLKFRAGWMTTRARPCPAVLRFTSRKVLPSGASLERESMLRM
jgi:hypothetical protein